MVPCVGARCEHHSTTGLARMEVSPNCRHGASSETLCAGVRSSHHHKRMPSRVKAIITPELEDPGGQNPRSDVKKSERSCNGDWPRRWRRSITQGSSASPVLAIRGYPAITVLAGYNCDGMPFGICFGGLRGTEPKLIEIAYDFEQATKVAAVTAVTVDIVSSEYSFREATVHDIRIAFERNELTSKELVEFYIREIKRLNSVLRERFVCTPGHNCESVPRDAGLVVQLREAGAIILGKASLSEWARERSPKAPSGWCARNGQAVNLYVKSADLCGSSTGSAISVAANMASVTLRTETDRPIYRMVSDAVCVLDAIVVFNRYDAVATRKASKYIPRGGYVQFLKVDGLRGKKLWISRYPSFGFNNSGLSQIFELSFHALRQGGAILVDHLEIPNVEAIDSMLDGEQIALAVELKLSLNVYFKDLVTAPVRSLADVIAFNKKFSRLVLAVGGYPGIHVSAGYDDEGTTLRHLFHRIEGFGA
ncbi:hypothetical protein Acr_09g0010470 [Actinidia rufa]|uniref:Amidase domain-containing protein n=1 Tax=Actinidia rufa TaxID=165716 RepID=A0A7J0F7K4_9ERIC|nr:hypothetical protein Acr_09g0010470 [Actinidia rufa]